MAPDRGRMGELHEEFLAELNGGRKSKASGSTWKDQGDGRNNELTEEFAFAWDGKSTLGKGITVDRAMIAKIREQAAGERPQLGLRFYGSEDLRQVDEDWILVTAADWAEVLAAARSAVHFSSPPTAITPPPQSDIEYWLPAATPPQLWPSPELHGTYPPDLPPPPHEMWPCLVVDTRHGVGEPDSLGADSDGYQIAADGRVTEYAVSSVRYDRGMGFVRLYVNDTVVRSGLLYVDGELRVRVGPGVATFA